MAALLERSLAKDPSVRPPDAGAFLAELEEAAEEKYGIGWWERASIGGLVASTLGVGTGAVAGSAGGAAPTVVAEDLPQPVTSSTRARIDTGRRFGTKTLLAAGATAAVVVVAAVAGISVAGSEEDDENSGGGPRSSVSYGPGGDASEDPDGDGDDEDIEDGGDPPGPSLETGITYQGTSRFNFDGGTGRSTITVTCDPTCVVSADSWRGKAVLAAWQEAAVGHTYTGAGARWDFDGDRISSCGKDFDDSWVKPRLWSASMMVTESRLVIDAVQEEFEGRTSGGGYCTTSRTTLRFEGTPIE